MNFTDYFSASYSVARERFRQAARVAGATALVAYEHPVQKGPDGESLSVDVAHLGNPRASRQMLLISGTHGQEGYAGSAAQVIAKEAEWGQVRLPSGEIRKIHLDCRVTIGQVSNLDHANVTIGKAGRSRWLGRRPHNRGVAMNQ